MLRYRGCYRGSGIVSGTGEHGEICRPSNHTQVCPKRPLPGGMVSACFTVRSSLTFRDVQQTLGSPMKRFVRHSVLSRQTQLAWNTLSHASVYRVWSRKVSESSVASLGRFARNRSLITARSWKEVTRREQRTMTAVASYCTVSWDLYDSSVRECVP